MIYKQATNFSYPILNNLQNDYIDGNFNINIMTDYKFGKNYQFNIELDLGSNFLLKQIEDGKAKLLLLVSSVGSSYYEFTLDNPIVLIPDNRIYLKERTEFQVIVMSTSVISFEKNEELHPFYKDFKNEIKVNKGKLLAFSNHYTFKGDIKKAPRLLEYRLNSNLKLPVDIELGDDTIVVEYKDESYNFNDLGAHNSFKNFYIYAGLQKALLNLISKNLSDSDESSLGLETGVAVERINEGTDLDMKLKDLLLYKGVETLHLDNIDQAVQLIANGIIENYKNDVRNAND